MLHHLRLNYKKGNIVNLKEKYRKVNIFVCEDFAALDEINFL